MLYVCRTARHELWRMPEVQSMRADATKCSRRVENGRCSGSRPCARVGPAGMRCCALLVPATQHGAGCGVQFVEESGGSRQATRAGCDGAALRTPSPLLPHLRRERVRWGVALAVGSAPEAMEERVPSVMPSVHL